MTKDLKSMTGKQLVAIHDGLCPPSDRIDGAWKKGKAELIRIIEDLEPKPEPKKNGHGIGKIIEILLTDTDLTYAEIVADVKAQVPEAKTTTRSVASIAKTLKQRGVKFASRKTVSQREGR